MAQQLRNRRFRRGMTLVELLMVVVIMTLLMAIAIPMVRPAFQNRQLREAARQTNAFFAGAMARAAEAGRPVGVWIEADGIPGDPQYASRLYLAEVAPSFTGAALGSRATIEFPSPSAPAPAARSNPPFTEEFDLEPLGELRFWDPNPMLNFPENPNPTGGAYLLGLVSQGEKFFIRFDHQGPLHPCMNFNGAFLVSLPFGAVPPGTQHVVPAPGPQPSGKTFEIIRGPSKSVVSPLILPGDAVLDLTVSGVGFGLHTNEFLAATPNAPIIIMFTPSGWMGEIFVNNTSHVPKGSVYLLVGRRSKVVDPTNATQFPDPDLSNLADTGNLWLKINSRTGTITTQDNAPTYALPAATTVFDRIKTAREFARTSVQKGGR